jgi:hypothetical protein
MPTGTIFLRINGINHSYCKYFPAQQFQTGYIICPLCRIHFRIQSPLEPTDWRQSPQKGQHKIGPFLAVGPFELANAGRGGGNPVHFMVIMMLLMVKEEGILVRCRKEN